MRIPLGFVAALGLGSGASAQPAPIEVVEVVGVTPLVLDLWSSHLEDDAKRLVSALADPTNQAQG